MQREGLVTRERALVCPALESFSCKPIRGQEHGPIGHVWGEGLVELNGQTEWTHCGRGGNTRHESGLPQMHAHDSRVDAQVLRNSRFMGEGGGDARNSLSLA